MKTPTSTLPVLALVLALSGACAAPAAPPPPDTDAMIAAAAALDAEFVRAFNAGDAAALSALYAKGPDTVSFMPDVMVARGFDGISASLAEGMAAGAPAKLEISDEHHVPLGNAVATWGLFTMTVNGPDGAPMTVAGRFTDIKAERDGKWVYLMDHASVPMPPPTAPAAR